MPEFLTLTPPDEARKLFLSKIPFHKVEEKIPMGISLGRTTTRPVFTSTPLPAFNRSTVDGYGLRAQDTFGASESMPAYLRIAGEVMMGQEPGKGIEMGACMLIHTGGMLPKNANAVVMLEDTQISHGNELEVLRPVAVGENVIKIGEDVAINDEVITAGTKLRSAEIGGLAAIGQIELFVSKRPRVAILSTGDEVVPPHQEPHAGEVRDINTNTLKAMLTHTGAVGISYGIRRDDFQEVLQAARQALDECDMLVFTAGSSASNRDITSRVIQSLGEPGVLVHGINIHPGKPTILAVSDGKPVIGLPGNPVSCLVIAWLYVKPAVELLSGLRPLPRMTQNIKVAINLPSKTGREDWIPVRIETVNPRGEYEPIAHPIHSRSNLIFSLVGAHGLVRIPENVNGVEAGQFLEYFPIE